MAIKEVKLEALCDVSMDDFSTFGRIIGRDEMELKDKVAQGPHSRHPAVDTDRIRAYWDIYDLRGETGNLSDLGTLYLRPKKPGELVDWTERHQKTYEMFFPMAGQFVFVLNPPDNSKRAPDIEKTRAFLIGPYEGVCLWKGTWHYPPFTLGGTTIVFMYRIGNLGTVVCSEETPCPLYQEGETMCLKTDWYGGEWTKDEFLIKLIV